MPISKALYPLFSHSVQLQYRTGQDMFGKPTYGATTTYKAHIERSNDLIKTDLGREVRASRKIFLYRHSWPSSKIPQPTDKVILPDTHKAETSTAQIKMAQVVSDENGVNHIVLWL